MSITLSSMRMAVRMVFLQLDVIQLAFLHVRGC